MKKIINIFRKIFRIKENEYITAKEFYQLKGTMEFLIKGNENLVEDVFKLIEAFNKLEKKLQNDSKSNNKKFKTIDDLIEMLSESSDENDKEFLKLHGTIESLTDYNIKIDDFIKNTKEKFNKLEKQKPENEVKDYAELLLKKLENKSISVYDEIELEKNKINEKFKITFNWFENALGNLQTQYNKLAEDIKIFQSQVDNQKTIRIVHENKN